MGERSLEWELVCASLSAEESQLLRGGLPLTAMPSTVVDGKRYLGWRYICQRLPHTPQSLPGMLTRRPPALRLCLGGVIIGILRADGVLMTQCLGFWHVEIVSRSWAGPIRIVFSKCEWVVAISRSVQVVVVEIMLRQSRWILARTHSHRASPVRHIYNWKISSNQHQHQHLHQRLLLYFFHCLLWDFKLRFACLLSALPKTWTFLSYHRLRALLLKNDEWHYITLSRPHGSPSALYIYIWILITELPVRAIFGSFKLGSPNT